MTTLSKLEQFERDVIRRNQVANIKRYQIKAEIVRQLEKLDDQQLAELLERLRA